MARNFGEKIRLFIKAAIDRIHDAATGFLIHSFVPQESVELRINLLRKMYFGQIFLSDSLNMSRYVQNIRHAHGAGPSPHSIEKSDSKRLSLATITQV